METSEKVPAHLKEIIDKGYDFIGTDDSLSLESGLAAIEPHSSRVVATRKLCQVDRPNVVFCFDGPFLPIRNGASYSLYNLLQNLGRDGRVNPSLLLCYRGSDSPKSYFDKDFRTLFITPEHYYTEDGCVEDLFENNRIRLVQFCSSEGLLNLGPRLKAKGVKVIFDIQNIDHVLESRLGCSAEQIEKTKQLQTKAIKYSDYVLCRSEIDMRYAVDMGATPSKSSVYNGAITVEDFTFNAERKNSKSLVFLAHMYYEPNENAFNFIVERVLPHLPDDYTLTVIGITPKHIVKNHEGNERITFKQNIDDISTELLGHGIALAPIFEGSGTRLKVLDYLASGIPVIATRLAVEGLVDEIEEVVSLKETGAEFVQEILAMSEDFAQTKKRSFAGRCFVEKHYDWKDQLEPFLRAYENA